MEDARALFFGGEQPRATWLCVSSDEYGQHSLHTYFPGLSNQTFTQQFAMMGGRNVKVTHADQTLFKADRLQSYGVHKWVAFGKTHPIHSVADQLGVCVTTAGAVFPAPELVGSRARRRRSPAHIDEDAAAAAATPPTMAPRDHDDDGVHHNDVHDDDDSESYDPDGPNSDDAVTINTDGFGTKRAFNHNLDGARVAVVWMVKNMVIDVECKQNSDCGVGGAKNYIGPAATAESHAVRDIAARQLTQEVPLFPSRVCSDADAKTFAAVLEAQELAGVPEPLRAVFSAVICHDVRAFVSLYILLWCDCTGCISVQGLPWGWLLLTSARPCVALLLFVRCCVCAGA